MTKIGGVSLRRLLRQGFDNGIVNRFGFVAHFVIICILDRMIDEDIAGVLHTERFALRICGEVKLA